MSLSPTSCPVKQKPRNMKAWQDNRIAGQLTCWTGCSQRWSGHLLSRRQECHQPAFPGNSLDHSRRHTSLDSYHPGSKRWCCWSAGCCRTCGAWSGWRMRCCLRRWCSLRQKRDISWESMLNLFVCLLLLSYNYSCILRRLFCTRIWLILPERCVWSMPPLMKRSWPGEVCFSISITVRRQLSEP